jgi:hypothetical protein
MTEEPDPKEIIEMLQRELDDAHLVIGRQQVALARQAQKLQEQENELRDK